MPGWRSVNRFEPRNEESLFGTLDGFAEKHGLSSLRFQSGDHRALTLKLSELGMEPSRRVPAHGWALVMSGTLSRQQWEELHDFAQESLPEAGMLSHRARLRVRTGTADELIIPGTRLCIELEAISVQAPKLGVDTRRQKLPEGPIGDRESWFRDRTARKDRK